MLSITMIGCGSKEESVKFKFGTYGIEADGVASNWAMTKYVFKDDNKVYVYALEQRYEDELYIYEYALSNTYDYVYDEEKKKVSFNDTTFNVSNKKITSTLLELVYESSNSDKPSYRVINANCNELQLQLDSNDEWIIVGTGSNLPTYTIPVTYEEHIIRSIKSNAFGLSFNLSNITIPSSITKIGKNVFNSTSNLTIVFESLIPCEQEGMLASIDNVTIKVPSESVDVYKSAWSEYASIIESR